MKVKFIDIIKSASGKVCQDSDTYMTTRFGNTFTGRLCNPFKGEATAEQIAVKNKFKTVAKQTSDILKEGPGGDRYDDYLQNWKNSDGKYVTLRGYIFSNLYNA